jgi:hypothetical protein
MEGMSVPRLGQAPGSIRQNSCPSALNFYPEQNKKADGLKSDGQVR